MSNSTDTDTLAEAFTKRLTQLGLSRREFAKRSGLSRQTLHNIENEQRTELAPATYAALDAALRWPIGKAHALAHGETLNYDEYLEERTNALRWTLVRVIERLSLEELETMVYQWADEPSNGG